MKILHLTTRTNSKKTLELCNEFNSLTLPPYTEPVYFHCYWSGAIPINEKHLASIHSCYYHNVRNHANRRILLWTDKNTIIDKPVEETLLGVGPPGAIQIRDIGVLANDTTTIDNLKTGPHKANYIRLLLLYHYGGVWFDLDIFFLRAFDHLFHSFGTNELVTYQWEAHEYANNAILIHLPVKSKIVLDVIKYFQIANNDRWTWYGVKFTDLSDNILVLPCSWFDPGWMSDMAKCNYSRFFNPVKHKGVEFDCDTHNWSNTVFTYHWHNQWEHTISPDSIFAKWRDQLYSDLDLQ